jgi:uncharacterized membrane protein YuzA (DUF378 family)
MFSLIVIGALSGLAGVVVYDFIQEIRGSSENLHDHYHGQ